MSEKYIIKCDACGKETTKDIPPYYMLTSGWGEVIVAGKPEKLHLCPDCIPKMGDHEKAT